MNGGHLWRAWLERLQSSGRRELNSKTSVKAGLPEFGPSGIAPESHLAGSECETVQIELGRFSAVIGLAQTLQGHWEIC